MPIPTRRIYHILPHVRMTLSTCQNDETLINTKPSYIQTPTFPVPTIDQPSLAPLVSPRAKRLSSCHLLATLTLRFSIFPVENCNPDSPLPPSNKKKLTISPPYHDVVVLRTATIYRYRHHTLPYRPIPIAHPHPHLSKTAPVSAVHGIKESRVSAPPCWPRYHTTLYHTHPT